MKYRMTAVALNLAPNTRHRLCTVALLSCLVPLPTFAGASFTGIGYPPGGASNAADISADGSTIVGDASDVSFTHAMRWTALTGLQILGDLPGGRMSYAVSVSADGSVVTGNSEFDPNVNLGRGFRWTEATGVVALENSPPETLFNAYDISDDGQIIVGVRGLSDTGNFVGVEAARWTAANGVEGLGFVSNADKQSVAYATNSNGSVIVGEGGAGNGIPGFRWTATGGMQSLGPLGDNYSTIATSVSADGSVVAGYAVAAFVQAFRWTAQDGMLALGVVPPGLESFAWDVSADGRVIVGQPAFRWTKAGGMRELRGLLNDVYNLNMSGWDLFSANAVSADGTKIVGSGINPQGGYEGWYAHIPPQVPAAGHVSTEGNTSTLLNWTPRVFDPEDDALTCRLLSQPVNGSATITNNCGSGTYKSKNGFVGTDSFTYITNDGHFNSNIATVTVEVNEGDPNLVCVSQYPISQFSQTGKQGTLSISLTGNITSHTNKEVKVCPGTALSFQAQSSAGSVVCKIKNNVSSGSGTLKIRDHLKCTDKPAGKDKLHFKVKSGITS